MHIKMNIMSQGSYKNPEELEKIMNGIRGPDKSNQ